jgi:hypothetical protein
MVHFAPPEFKVGESFGPPINSQYVKECFSGQAQDVGNYSLAKPLVGITPLYMAHFAPHFVLSDCPIIY